MAALTRDEQFDVLIAKDEIRDLVLRLASAVDRNDHDGIRAAYWPDAHEDHGLGYEGSVDGFIEFIDQLNTANTMFHQISNHYVEVDGDAATGEVYVQTFVRSRGDDIVDFIPTGRYLDRYERRDGDWRIAERHIVIDWQRTDPVTSPLQDLVTPEYEGSSSEADPSYAHFGRQATAR